MEAGNDVKTIQPIKTILPEEMQQLEKSIFDKSLMSPELLMEKAAFEVVTYIQNCYGLGRVLFLCGPGNNGGDGFAAARLYKTGGGEPVVWYIEENQSPQCKTQREILCQLWPEVEQKNLFYCQKEPLEKFVCIVDGLFGTGLSKNLSEELLAVIRKVNEAVAPVVAIDIPSGIHGATGLEMGGAIKATVTLTFHRPKKGLYVNQGIEAAGEIKVCPIGIPPRLDGVEGIMVTNENQVKKSLGARKSNSHKGDYGKILVIAGSLGMAGAAVFAAKSALRAGAGLVTLACDKALVPILQLAEPGAMCLPLTGSEKEQLDQIKSRGDWDAVVFGPGIGREKDCSLLVDYLAGLPIPVIWDADGLFYLKKHFQGSLPSFHILTPHLGEAARLLGKNIKDLDQDPVKIAKEIHGLFGASVVVKGAKSLLYNGESFAFNPRGTPAMAKGGSGDMLSGLLGAFAARLVIEKDNEKTRDVLPVLQTACYLHGLAGEYAQGEKGENGVLTLDMIEQIPLVMKAVLGR